MKDANREVLDRGSLAELLAQRARQASDLRLALDAAIGFVLTALLVIFRPPLWLPLTGLAFALGAFGVWGILDREVADTNSNTTRGRSVVVVRSIVAMLGVVAAIVGGLVLFFGLLGTWIS
jgi:hypothetical protein